MPRTTLRLSLVLAAIAFGSTASADERHSIANPTPREEMRPLSTDRPDMTESPISVDPGHVQVEMDMVSTAIDREGDVRTRSFSLGTTNLRIGLLPRVDFQIVYTPFSFAHTRAPGQARTNEIGTSDVVLRTKVNLFGNDSGNVAIGLLPFVTIPAAYPRSFRAERAEFGLAVPMAFALPGEVSLGAMVQFELVSGATDRYAYETLGTLTASHAIVGALNGFVEVASRGHYEDGAEFNFEVHGGLTYLVNDSLQLDTGVFGTVYGPGDDLFGFVGIVFRR